MRWIKLLIICAIWWCSQCSVSAEKPDEQTSTPFGFLVAPVCKEIPTNKLTMGSGSIDCGTDFAPFMNCLNQRVVAHWKPSYGCEKFRIVVTFEVERNGSISNLHIKQATTQDTSTNPDLDRTDPKLTSKARQSTKLKQRINDSQLLAAEKCALDAIRTAQPFKSPPDLNYKSPMKIKFKFPISPTERANRSKPAQQSESNSAR